MDIETHSHTHSNSPIDSLMDYVGDNEEALQVLDEAKNQYSSIVNKLQEYEKETKRMKDLNQEVIQSRDKLKGLIRDTLGIEEVSRDTITERLGSLGDSTIKESYQKQLQETRKVYEDKIRDYQNNLESLQSEIKSLKLQDQIKSTDVLKQANGDKAAEMLVQLLSADAEFIDGQLVYLGKAGETLLNENGDPMTLQDRIAEIKRSKDYDFLFNPRYLNGASTPKSAPASSESGQRLTRTQMTMEQKQEYVQKYGMEAYEKLPLV